jgi:GTP-binding protein HflX
LESSKTDKMHSTKPVVEKAILVGLYSAETERKVAEEHLDELEQLLDTAGGVVVRKVLQNRLRPDPATYVGKGKLDDLGSLAGTDQADLIIFDDDLSPTQTRNIQKATNTKIVDRSGIILDIFASRAKTSAAKLQVELAQLQYLLPRLTRLWTHLSRQKGGIGTKGPGETQIETDRRLIGKRIATLKEKLEKLDQQRVTQRKGRELIPRAALVGYTNAGKSTLMNALTHTQVLAEDRLFATLDATVRRLQMSGQPFLLSDTVGFIRKLPHHLIESFKSTLDEIREADILIHLVDGSSPVLHDYIEVVKKTLVELGVESKPTMLVFNKMDRIQDPQVITELHQQYPEAIFISAEQKIGLKRLEEELVRLLNKEFIIKSLVLSHSDHKKVAWIHELADVLDKRYEDDGIHITFRVHQSSWKTLANKVLDVKKISEINV